MKILSNIDITNLSTLKIKQMTKYYLRATSLRHVKMGLRFATINQIPYYIIGNGSKVLFKKTPFNGIIIHNSINKISIKNNLLTVESGTKLPHLACWCAENSLKGFEWAEGIPGTVGGAIYMNAGAFGSTTSDRLVKVKTLDSVSLKVNFYEKNQFTFKHRYSSFQRKREFITEGIFQVDPCPKKEILEIMKRNREYRQSTQPTNYPTLGSTFKQVWYKGKMVSAGFLIDRAGCKNLIIGGAEISEKHANFIVNKRGATSKDVLKLIEIVKNRVKSKFGVNLKLEIRIV